MKRLVFLILVMTPLACQTTKNYQPVSLPAALDSYFSICENIDGAASMSVSNEEQFMGNFDLDWISQFGGSWTAEALSPIGETLARVDFNYKSGVFLTTGTISNFFNQIELSVNSEKFLLINQNFIGLKSIEIPCLLSFRLPRSWLNYATSVRQTSGEMTFVIEENDRTINIVFANIRNALPDRICSTIIWHGFLNIVEHNIRYCIESGQSVKRAKIDGIKGYKLEWVDINDNS